MGYSFMYPIRVPFVSIRIDSIEAECEALPKTCEVITKTGKHSVKVSDFRAVQKTLE
jgi:hypothetical protein